MAGLPGITITGAVLRSRQKVGARHGAAGPAAAYLGGCHRGLIVTIALVTSGALVSHAALRPMMRQIPARRPSPAESRLG